MLHGGVQPTCSYSALPPCWTGSRKRDFHCTEQLCMQVGIQYRPIVLESHGGYSRAAASLLHRLADVVASAEGTDALIIRQRLFEQIAIAVARALGP